MNTIITPKFGANKIATVLSKYNYQVKKGDILAGTFIGNERKQTLINVGLKQAAILPNQEFAFNAENYQTKIKNTEVGEFLVLDYNPGLDKTIVSFRRLHTLKLWERFKQIDFKNMVLFTKPVKSIWGGNLVNFDGLTVFLPNSHVPKYHRRKNSLDYILPIKILEVKDKKHKIVGSPRLAILKKHSQTLNLGLIQTACVLAVKPFGIFLNIYGVKCLLHISEISDRKITNLKNLYKKGDLLKIKIIYLNSSQGKIAVSAKQVDI